MAGASSWQAMNADWQFTAIVLAHFSSVMSPSEAP
jgi:hypothetical protein